MTQVKFLCFIYPKMVFFFFWTVLAFLGFFEIIFGHFLVEQEIASSVLLFFVYAGNNLINMDEPD